MNTSLLTYSKGRGPHRNPYIYLSHMYNNKEVLMYICVITRNCHDWWVLIVPQQARNYWFRTASEAHRAYDLLEQVPHMIVSSFWEERI